MTSLSDHCLWSCQMSALLWADCIISLVLTKAADVMKIPLPFAAVANSCQFLAMAAQSGFSASLVSLMHQWKPLKARVQFPLNFLVSAEAILAVLLFSKFTSVVSSVSSTTATLVLKKLSVSGASSLLLGGILHVWALSLKLGFGSEDPMLVPLVVIKWELEHRSRQDTVVDATPVIFNSFSPACH